MTLEQLKAETRKSAQTLAEIDTAIATGRVEAKRLQDTIGEYIATREKEADQAITDVINEARERLAEIGLRYTELLRYRSNLFAYAEALKTYTQQIIETHQTLEQSSKVVIDLADRKLAELRELGVQLDSRETEIKESNIELTRQKQILENTAKSLESQRVAHELAKKELGIKE